MNPEPEKKIEWWKKKREKEKTFEKIDVFRLLS